MTKLRFFFCFLWAIINTGVISLFTSMFTEPNTVANVMSLVVLYVWVLISWQTVCFNRLPNMIVRFIHFIKSKKDEK